MVRAVATVLDLTAMVLRLPATLPTVAATTIACRSSAATVLLAMSDTVLLPLASTTAARLLLLLTVLRSIVLLTTLTTGPTRPQLCPATRLLLRRRMTVLRTLRRCLHPSLRDRATPTARSAIRLCLVRPALRSWPRRTTLDVLVWHRLCLVLAMQPWTRTGARRRWIRWQALRTTRATTAGLALATSLIPLATSATAAALLLGERLELSLRWSEQLS